MKYYYFNDEKYPISVTDETRKITPHTFTHDGQLWEQQALCQFYKGIDTAVSYNIVDIGAQSGLYSLFAKYLPLSTFYAFEPFITTFELLNDNLKLNEITNVKTYNLAMSDKEGVSILNTSISHNGLNTLGQNPLRFNDVCPINVNTTTLDLFFYNIPVHYIKIDTEGYEYYILKGGKEIIKKYKPIIQIEYNITNMKQCNVTEDMINILIQEIEYKFISISEEEILIGPMW